MPTSIPLENLPPDGYHTRSTGGLTDEQRAERVVSYDETAYGFVEMAFAALKADGLLASASSDASSDASEALSRLHEGPLLPKRAGKNDPCTTSLNNRVRNSITFARALSAFVRNEVCPALGVSRVAYQRRPTMRVHLSGAKAMGKPHADGLEPYNHQPGEVNVWVPLTKVWGSNSLTSERAPGLGDFHAFKAAPGEFVRFDGNRCWHYTTANDTARTRVSFDFRVVPIELVDETHRGPSRATRGANGKNAAAADVRPLRMGEYYVDSGVDVVDEDDEDDEDDYS